MGPANIKGTKVRELLAAHPHYADDAIAAAAGCSASYVNKIRNDKAAYVPKGTKAADMCVHNYSPNEYCPACSITPATAEDFSELVVTPELLDAVLEAEAVLNEEAIGNIEAILNERGARYGAFVEHAYITQRLKEVMADTPNWIILDNDMKEALEMVAHKIGRILNGDPSYADSWVDIAGYSQLVADRLEGKVR